MNTKVNYKAKLKLKELGEFRDVLEKAFGQFCWAQDFTTFSQIQDWSERVLEVVDDIRDEVDDELSYIDSKLADYDFELTMFEKEHEVEVN
jgi:hypothetical protein